MSADVNNFNLREPDPGAWDQYVPGSSGSVVLPPSGIYQVIPSELPTLAEPQDGYLTLNLGPLAVYSPGQPWDGYGVLFTRVSLRPWPNRKSSGIIDYLKSHGYAGRPQTNAEFIAACESVVGHPAVAALNHKVYCNVCKMEIKGQENLPKEDDGTSKTRFTCPNKCKQANRNTGAEEEKLLFVNVEVRSFLSPDRLK